MPESYWRKTLSDNSIEFGHDSNIDKKLASWTRGRQDIVSTKVSFGSSSISITSSPKDNKLSEWGQYDNFSFSAGSGVHTRLSREIRCSVNGYTRLCITKDTAGVYKITNYELNDNIGIHVPSNARYLVCQIEIDGKVNHEWR